MECSKLPLRKWAMAMYLMTTSLKGVSGMKVHRDLGITQKSTWFMIHRIREAWNEDVPEIGYAAPVEVDETYIGGQTKNRRPHRRSRDHGRGTWDKLPVVGMKDRDTNEVRALPIDKPDTETLQDFVLGEIRPGAKVYTDGHWGYRNIPNPEFVNHSVGEYVRGMAHTNGIEGFWAALKRALPRQLPQDERQAPGAVRKRVRRAPQSPRTRHDRPDARDRGGIRGAAADVPRPDRGCGSRGWWKRRVLGAVVSQF